MTEAALYGVSEERARQIAREEIASLSGLVLRRLQEFSDHRLLSEDDMSSIFGEAHNDFGKTQTGPGPT